MINYFDFTYFSYGTVPGIIILAHNSNPIMSDDEDIMQDTTVKDDRKPSKPSLSFCNVIVTAAMNSAPVAPESGLQAVAVPRPILGSPLILKNPVGNNQHQSSTVGNNRTIAAMWSAPAQSGGMYLNINVLFY